MKFNVIGKTNIRVSELGLGGLFVSSLGSETCDGKAAVFRAMELGVNYIDTAPNYCNSEEVLGMVLKDITKPLVLSTKLGGRPVPFLPQDRDCLMKSVEESLRFLHRDYIDILFIHEPDRPDMYDWWTDNDQYTGPVMKVLESLKKDGVIGHLGLAGTTAYKLANIMRTGKFDVVLTAFNYSLLWREAEHEIIPVAKEQNMGIIIGSPLQQGDLARKYDELLHVKPKWLSTPRHKQFLALYKFLDEIQIPLPELALRFVISNPCISCVLTGARSVKEVEQNVEAMEKGPLSQEIIQKLQEIADMVPFRPYEEPFILPFEGKYGIRR